MGRKILSYTILFQSAYYIISGLWPIVNLQSFEFITGDKNNIFLLYTISLLIILIGLTLLISFKKEKSKEVLFLAFSSPLAFIIMEVWFRAEIRWTYFLDFAVEVIILALLVFGLFTRKQKEESSKSLK